MSENTKKDSIKIYDKEEFKEVPLNDGDQVSNIKGADDGRLIGYCVTSSGNSLQSVLNFYDTSTGIVFRPNGLDGNAISVKDWIFMPDGESIVVVTKSNDLLAITLNNDDITPLGYADSLRGLESDTLLIVGNKGKFEKLNLETLDKTPITTTLFTGQGPLLGNYLPIKLIPESSLTQITHYSYVDESYLNTITSRRNENDSQLLQIMSKDTLLLSMNTTQNGSYALIETAQTTNAIFDGYRLSAKPNNVKTKIINMESGAVCLVIDGFNVIETPKELL